jgi:serine/threonine-protein kinase
VAIVSPRPTSAPQVTPDGEPAGALAAGTIIAERYRVVSLLGEGGMGVVYRVEHVHMRKALALKVLNASFSKSPEVIARFEREAIAAGSIDHPNVVGATDFGKLPDGSLFLVLELVNGRSLRSHLEGGAVEPYRAIWIMRGVLSAVGAAHAKGIVHRDLKPENVMLVQREGGEELVKVLDFGIAKVDTFETSRDSAVQALTQLGTIMGTPDYMSPEQALGKTVDARSDLYALGVIFFELLTGRCPFQGSAVAVLRQHVQEAPPSLPPELAATLSPLVPEVLARLLAKDPGARFQTAGELLGVLDEIAAGAPLAAPTPSAQRLPVGAATTGRFSEVSLPVLLTEARRAAERLEAIVPPTARAYVTRQRLIVFAVALGALVVGIALMTCGSRSPQPQEQPRASTRPSSVPSAGSNSAPVHPPWSATSSPSVIEVNDEDAGVALTVPTALPSAQTRRSPSPAPRPSQRRKTGPGGIYIPPPSEWFK